MQGRKGIAGGGASVVVATADTDTVELTGLVLSHRLGVETTLARDGVEALEEVRRLQPDLLLIDMNLGKLGVRTICRLLKADRRTQRVRIVGLVNGASDQIYTSLADCDDFVLTPVDLWELESCLRLHLQL